ncbi:cytochrome b [Phytobacter sp. V91]|uniref:cytochrome b n=1 Tax=Phytobacter sp. V91 TaxID=3369425 RepID=UPI003F60EF38
MVDNSPPLTSRPVTRWLQRLPLPKTVRGIWLFSAGALLLLMLLVQTLSGIILAMFYISTVESAYASIIHIMRNVKHGELIRDAHMIGASLFFFACYLHMLRSMYYVVYRKPYLKMWMISVTLYLLLMVTAFLGYSLIWGQKSYWAATVITEFAHAVPVIGDDLHSLLIGGYALGTPTLGRFYVLHFILPFIIILMTVVHIRTVRHAYADAMKREFSAKDKCRLLFDYKMTHDDAVKITLFLMLFSWLLFFAPNYLSSADNYIPADPTVTPLIVAPEWYFLPLFSILRCFPGELLGISLMGGAVLVFYLLPWLDTSTSRFRHHSIIVKICFLLWVLNALFLGWLGSKALVGPDLIDWLSGRSDEQGWIRPASQLSTIIYFAWFLLLLPCRRFLEKQS